jgi:hypothetical protein
VEFLRTEKYPAELSGRVTEPVSSPESLVALSFSQPPICPTSYSKDLVPIHRADTMEASREISGVSAILRDFRA